MLEKWYWSRPILDYFRHPFLPPRPPGALAKGDSNALCLHRVFEEFIDQLIELRLVKTVGGEYPVISLTPAGEIALKEKRHIQLTLPKGVLKENIIQKNEQLKAKFEKMLLYFFQS